MFGIHRIRIYRQSKLGGTVIETKLICQCGYVSMKKKEVRSMRALSGPISF